MKGEVLQGLGSAVLSAAYPLTPYRVKIRVHVRFQFALGGAVSFPPCCYTSVALCKGKLAVRIDRWVELGRRIGLGQGFRVPLYRHALYSALS